MMWNKKFIHIDFPEPGFYRLHNSHAKTPPYFGIALSLAREWNCLDDPLVQRYLQILRACPWDTRVFETAKERIYCLRKQIFYIPKAYELAKRGIFHGFSVSDLPIYTPYEESFKPSITVSSTGGGKTIKNKAELRSAVEHFDAVWIFDPFKNEYRDVVAVGEDLGKRFIVCPAERGRFNWLQVQPGVPPQRHLSSLASDFCECFEIPMYSRMLIRNAIHSLYERCGVYSGSSNYPSLSDLIEELQKNTKDAGVNYLIERLDYVNNNFDEEFIAGWTVDQLIGHNIIWELARFDTPLRIFFIKRLLTSVFESSVENHNMKNGLRMNFEEAHNILREGSSAEDTTRLARGAKISIDASTQTTHNLSRVALDNMGSLFIGRIGGEDLQRVKKIMNLTEEQVEWWLSHQDTGVFIAKYNYGQLQKAFLVKVPLPNIPFPHHDLGRTDLGQLESIKVVRRQDKEIYVVSDTKNDMDTFLQAANKNPWKPSTIVFQACGFSMRKGTDISKDAIRHGFIREWKAEIGPGRPRILFELTDAGREHVGIQKEHQTGKEGFLHKYFRHLIKEAHEKRGDSCEDEKNGVDLVVNKSIAIEIELHDTPHFIVNITRDLKFLFPRVEIICRNDKLAKTLEKKAVGHFSKTERERIKFHTLSSYIKGLGGKGG